MGLTIPEDKKKNIEKEKKAVEEKLAVLTQFKETVDVVEKFCNDLKSFDSALKTIDSWMMSATKELEDIKHSSDKMPPEDRVARTMDLQEDIAAKMKIIKTNIETELNLLPQGRESIVKSEKFNHKLLCQLLHIFEPPCQLFTYFLGHLSLCVVQRVNDL